MIKRSEGAPISGPMLIEKAKELYAKMELPEEFAFSDGWLAGFKTTRNKKAGHIWRTKIVRSGSSRGIHRYIFENSATARFNT
jgi:hypothetical protein